jgi:hypothetical protein
MTRMTIFRSNRLAIALVGAAMAPAFAAAQQGTMDVALTSPMQASQTQAGPPAIRPGEFYAAPWVEPVGGPANAGVIVGTGDVPGIPLTEAERPLQSHERVFVTVPPGMSAAAGARYISVRRGPLLEGFGQVIVPTGIVVVERAQPGQAAEARVVARFEPVQIGDQLVPMNAPPAGTGHPAVVGGGAETSVLWIKSEPVLPSLQSYVVVAAAPGMRVGDQISFYRPRRTSPRGVILPETEIAVARLVRVTPQGATALIVDQTYGGIEPGTAARVTAKMP